jgi:hypothetical protein
MPLNKPTVGQTGWGPVLNAALDYLDTKTSATGPTGAQGPAGATGATGPQGAAGPTGAAGADGIDAELGEDTTFTVAGGTLGTQPTFTGAPLFTGSYVKTGSMVHFRIDVDMDNITSFGTGQYYVDLPFPAKYNYHFRNACLHDVSMPRQFGLSGHVFAGESRVTLFYTDTSGQDVAFDYNSPALLTVNDNFHIAGDYIWEPEAP